MFSTSAYEYLLTVFVCEDVTTLCKIDVTRERELKLLQCREVLSVDGGYDG